MLFSKELLPFETYAYCIHIIFIGVISTVDCTLCDDCLHQKCLVFWAVENSAHQSSPNKETFFEKSAFLSRYNSYAHFLSR